ncbi:pimeloyl-ACP methyl ester carboxylesterase [Microbacterium resistens]|uniref:Pimeloyl-ACP methyl ester carboxylesterase n=1 Tax=Microbacterium resistens TaxID=156977 RepID=A0ABU1SBY1_9MICO|nr:alpha/beta hydrolase [Microbacterium resistens]MDR6866407.1 pimeloyl-ACP methyl ester carboxylesterase [Microbacterium resistens]
MPIETTEFSFLADHATALGVSVPPVTRISLTLPDERTLSALRFGDGPPVATFLHGAGLNAHTWDPTILALGLPALAIDLAGHGDSSWRDDLDYSARPHAADVAAAIDAWADAPQVVVGQSLGGLTAAALAAERPDLVRAAVIVDITPGIDASGGPAALRAFYAVTDFASRDEVVEHALSFGLGGSRQNTERGVFLNTRIRPDGRVEWKHHLARLASQAFAADTSPGSIAAPGQILHEDGWEDLAAVTAPITLVRALRGFVSETDAEEFSRRVPAARVLTLDAPHNAQETSPADLADLVRAHVAENRP